jgi:hypothetical protein
MMQIETVSEVLHGTASPNRPPSNNKILLHTIKYLFIWLDTVFPTHIHKMTSHVVKIGHSDFNRTGKFLKMNKNIGNEDQD